MKQVVAVVLMVGVVMLGGLGVARADERYYVWTYEYSTVSKGNAEIEFYQTATTKDKSVSSGSDWEQQLELEYGVTDHLDVGIYEVFEQPKGGSFSYAGFKAKARYRIAEKNVLPVDVLLYLEHVQQTSGDNALEGKVILAKDIGKINLAYNLIYERAYETGRGVHEYAAGASYEINPILRVGVESTGSYTEGEYAVGPTIAWVGNRLWANLGAMFGLNRKTDDQQFRFLLGVPF